MQEEIEIGINLETIKDIPFDKYENDFTIIVNGEEYQTNRYVIDILSPRIRQYHFIDASMNRFYIYTTDKQDIKSQEKYFKDILSLISFEKIKKIDDDEIKFMIRIFYAFGNTEIVKQLITRKETSNEMTIENAIENILQKQSFLESIQSTQYGTNKQLNSTDKFNDINEFDDIHFFDNELKFIANHFYELKNEQKVKLGFEFLKEIIKSNELRLETEDSLLEFINSIYIENPKASILYEFVYFNNVSDESIQKFSEIFDISHISNKILKSIIERSIESKGKKTKDENKNKRYVTKSKISQFLYKNGHEFDGIIKFLTDQTHGNIHDNGTIAVTYNKCCWDPKNLLDLNESNAYQATGTDCWICFDFKNRKIKMTGYSIKSYRQAHFNNQSCCWNV